MKVEQYEGINVSSGRFDDIRVVITLDYHDFAMLQNREHLKETVEDKHFPHRKVEFNVNRL